MATSSGASIRASAKRMPDCAPAAMAIRLTASMTGPCAVSLTSTMGCRRSSSSPCCAVIRLHRSIAKVGNHKETMIRFMRAYAMFEPKLPGPQAASAKQFGAHARHAGCHTVPAVQCRRRSGNPPAQPGSGKIRKAFPAQQVQHHAIAFRRQHEPTDGREIEHLGIAHDLADDEGQLAASYAFFHCP